MSRPRAPLRKPLKKPPEIFSKPNFNTKEYSLDIETTGLDRYTDTINVAGVFAPDGSVEQPTTKESYIKTHNNLNLTNSLVIAHNAKFDTKFIEHHYNVKFNNVIDTMFMAYLYDPYAKSYGLKTLVKKWFNVEYDVDLDTKVGTSDTMLEYHGKDLMYTYALYKLYKNLLSERELKLAWYLTKIDRLYDDVSERGVLWDAKQCALVAKQLEKQLDEIKSEAIREAQKELEDKGIVYDVSNMNISSSTQMQKLLYDILDYPILGYTKAGKPSTEGKIMRKLGTPLALKISEYKKTRTTYTTFIKPNLGKNIIHPQFKLNNTTSGRTASSKPKLGL